MSPLFKSNCLLKVFGWLKVPLVGQTKPKIVSIDESCCVLKVPLCRKTKNHLNSMYFGALSIGAEAAAGIMAFEKVHDAKKPVSIIFKDFHADFHKRAAGDVYFTCNEGKEISNTIQQAIETKDRQNITVSVAATTPDVSKDEVIASFKLTISFKHKAAA